MKGLAFILLLATPLAAQDLFPRFSITAGSYDTSFSTDVRVDPEVAGGEGTAVNIERDLGLASAERIERFTAQWRPFRRHELAGSWMTSSRTGSQAIDREIRFRDEVYPVQAQVETDFGLEYWNATYTYWVRRGERDGLGLMLGVSGLSLDARLVAQRPGQAISIAQEAQTEVPVAVVGAQARFAVTPRLFFEASASTLPEVEIDVYSGSAVVAAARLEYRFIRNLGVGAAYNFFSLDGRVGDADFGGELGLRLSGPEIFARFAF